MFSLNILKNIPDIAQFIAVRKKKYKSNPNNPFFILMQDPHTIKELSDLINSESSGNTLSMKIQENRLYIFLVDNIKANLSIGDKEYKLINRHLTIDKFYLDTPQQHGLYPAHYTEEYEELSPTQTNVSRIKVHVYLDKNGNCSYIKSTQRLLKESKELIPSTLIKNFEDHQTLKNCEIACKLFTMIIQKRNQLLEGLISSSNLLEEEITSLLHAYMSSNKNQEFFNVLQEKIMTFIDTIHKINLYSDSDLDMRWKVSEEILNHLAKNFTSISSKEKETVDISSTSEEISSSTKSTSTSMLIIDNASSLEEATKLICQLKETYRLLKILKSKHGEQQTKHIITMLNLLQQGKEILLQLEFMSYKPKITEHQSLIDSMNDICFSTTSIKKNEKLIQEILKSFKDYCIAGELIEVEEIFPHIKHKIDDNFLKNLVKEILENCIYFKPKIPNQEVLKQQEENAVKILNFLYNNVLRYQTILPYIIESNSCSYEERNLDFLDKYILLCFPLLSCALNNKFLLFTSLLEQGVSANGTGLLAINSEITCYALSIIKSCIILHNYIKPIFINKLFEHGASIINNKFCTIINSEKKLLEALKFTEKNTRTLTKRYYRVNLNKIHIETIPEFHYFIQLVPHMNFLDINLEATNINTDYIDECLDNILKHSNPTELIVLFLYVIGKHEEQLILHDRKQIKEKLIINFNQKLDLSQINIDGYYYLTYIFNLQLTDQSSSDYINKIINKLHDEILTIAHKKSKELDYLIKIAIAKANLININQKFSNIHQKNHIILLKTACIKSVLLLISFKDKIYHTDLEIIRTMYKQREEIYDIMQQYNPNVQILQKRMQTIAAQIEGNLIIKSDVDTITFMYPAKNNIQLAYCEPPPGSQVINGITIVPPAAIKL